MIFVARFAFWWAVLTLILASLAGLSDLITARKWWRP